MLVGFVGGCVVANRRALLCDLWGGALLVKFWLSYASYNFHVYNVLSI